MSFDADVQQATIPLNPRHRPRRASRSADKARVDDGLWSTAASTCRGQARPGVICRSATGRTPRSTTASTGGRRGVWLAIFEVLAERSPQPLHLIDSSIVRARQRAAGAKKRGPDHAIGLAPEYQSERRYDRQPLPLRHGRRGFEDGSLLWLLICISADLHIGLHRTRSDRCAGPVGRGCLAQSCRIIPAPADMLTRSA